MKAVLRWITLYPNWYVSERKAIARRYPDFRVDEKLLSQGVLRFYGELVVRPSGGTLRHPVALGYPDASPFEPPVITPLEAIPEFDEKGVVKAKPSPRMFDRRHQMPNGALCLFQRETRSAEGGEWISGVDALRRAEQWFLGHHTGRWPPESHESELEAHFYYAGDVLLSSTFYGDDVEGQGRFFMVRDMRRVLDGGQENPPLIVTVMTQKSDAIDAIFDAREELQLIYPWLGNDTWSPEKLVELESMKREEDFFGISVEHGVWWSVLQEPPPFHNGAGLLKVLDEVAPDGDGWKMICEALGGELTHVNHFFGLKYPARDGRPEWLVLVMPRLSKEIVGGGVLLSNDGEKRRLFDRGRVHCCRSHSARPQDIHLRNTSVVSTKVRGKCVALIGLGALGGRVGEMLAQAGVEHFRLCDNDRLSTGNVSRHIGGLKDFGLWKTDIVARRLFELNPVMQVDVAWNESVDSSLDALADFMRPADLVISTTADENVEAVINQVAVLEQKPVVYGRALRRGSMGRVFLVRPRKDACKACLGRMASESRSGKLVSQEWPDVTESDDDVLLHECGRPVIPASALDLSVVASLAARMALDFLEEKPQETNHWLWSAEPATDVSVRFEQPMTCVRWQFDRQNECPVCSAPDVSGVVLSEEAREVIVREVESSLSTETGGILLGYVDESRTAVVVRSTGPGPAARMSAGGFDRDVEYVQTELERAATHFGSRGLYLGEWHSHLEADPDPSPVDVGSMSEIACSSNYATRCPVLLIAGLDTQTGRVATLKTWCFQAYGRMHRVQCTVSQSAE